MSKDATTKQAQFRHMKTGSLRDLMLGKKTVKALPDNFFEKVLDLEIKLKKGFSMEILQELVNYYSCAIEYFESVEDPRYKEYQMSLNLLLTQPEILKKMSSLNKTGKLNVNPAINSNSYAKKLKQEQVKKQVKMKVDFAVNTENREIQVKKLITEVEKPHEINSIVNKDISNQEENFKKRLEEKRKKTLLSTSDLTDQIDSIKNKRVTFEKNNNNKSFIIEDRKNDMMLPNDLDGDNLSFNNLNVNPGHEEVAANSGIANNFIESLNNSFDRLEIAGNPNLLSGSKKLEDIEVDFETPAGDVSVNSPNKYSKLKTPKQKQIFNDLKTNMDTFLTDFNYYFFDEVFQNVVEETQKILEEKHKKTLEISKNYNNQIKEHEFLMGSDTEGSYKESFASIIEQLKEELTSELEKLDDEYNHLIKENKKKYRNMTLKSNHGIQLIEEKFRYDMFNSINNILYPKGVRSFDHVSSLNNSVNKI